ncbi:MAG: ROK family protein [Candidatus Marinimicrobia bacterium]|nr:ROK family protein [Candidatus Neomarinimicrobiota bacterium]
MKYYAGIDFGGTGIKVGIIDEKGNILIKDSFVTDPRKSGNEIVEHIAECTKKVIDDSKLPQEQILGIGIGSPGLLNPETGQLKIVTNIPNLNGVYLTKGISDRLNKPAFLDNDVNAMSLGEFYYGSGKGKKNVIALTLGTGVGGGIILNGELYRGSTFTAGEIGHMSIARDGKYCGCGNYGCLERYVGKDGIIERFEMYRSKGIETSIGAYLEDGKVTPKAIALAAADGDKISVEVLKETGEILGHAIATLVNILNPEMIIIGGGISNAGELLMEPVRTGMLKHAYTIPAAAVEIVRAQLGNDAGLVGSASLAVANLK